MQDNNKSSSSSSFIKGFLFGGIIGAGLALLYAPKTGRELREEIKKRTSELKDEATKIVEQELATTKKEADKKVKQTSKKFKSE